MPDREYVRHKATCPNCFGVVLRLPTSPLASVGISASTVDGTFHLRVAPRSRADQPVRALVAVAPRRGPATHARGPTPVTVPAAGESQVDFELPAAVAGVVTYRVLVVCDGAVELYTAIDRAAPTRVGVSLRTRTAALDVAEIGNGRGRRARAGPIPPVRVEPDGVNPDARRAAHVAAGIVSSVDGVARLDVQARQRGPERPWIRLAESDLD